MKKFRLLAGFLILLEMIIIIAIPVRLETKLRSIEKECDEFELQLQDFYDDCNELSSEINDMKAELELVSADIHSINEELSAISRELGITENSNQLSSVDTYMVTAGVSTELLRNIDIDSDKRSIIDNNSQVLSSLYDDIEETDIIQWTSTRLNVRSAPSTESDKIETLSTNTQVQVTGIVEGGEWYRINYNDAEAYVYAEYLQDYDKELGTYNYDWNGPVLNSVNGTVQGPNGKETYYNLDMSRVVSIMDSKGYGNDYWVRSDGVKMLGNYIIVAANLDAHPRGTLVETSLGWGIVCDTGEFAQYDREWIDIAVTW